MNSTRRKFISGLAAITSTSLFSQSSSQMLSAEGHDSLTENYPDLSGTYLNNASRHPMPKAAAAAAQDYISNLTVGNEIDVSLSVRTQFANLINANLEEITYAASTTLGENLIIEALDIPARGGQIITDAMHFIGSFYLYEQLKKQGMDVIILPPQEDGTVSLEQYEEAVTQETVLISVSHISWINGFEHDLKSLSDIAHSAGAYLYVDLIQSAGNTPIDVKAMGIDFASCGTYKWLMGDFGLAFLYANKSNLEELKRPHYGYLQTTNFVSPETHMYPLDPPGTPKYVSSRREGIAGVFSGSFPPRMIEAAANISLKMILETGVEVLQAQRQPLINALQSTLRERGFRPYTPQESKSPIVSFIKKDSESLNERLAQANISISTYRDRFRISPSFYNDMNDIDRVIDILGRA
ncbi:MAG: aminotransferase [Gammaproteobacteria bacterium]|nr:aminotransferase [Gammaproteobacteria bacterium]